MPKRLKIGAISMGIRHLILILGDQLTLDNPALDDFDADQDVILIVEAAGEASHVWSHKARIALFFSAMRHFAQLLSQQGMPLIYLILGKHDHSSLKSAWHAYTVDLQPEKIIVCEPGEYRLLQDIKQCAFETNTFLAVRDDTHFMCSQADFRRWSKGAKTLRMEFFYRWMRKQHGILMQQDALAGGVWNFDAENRQPFGKGGPQNIPKVPVSAHDAITQQVWADVEKHFSGHPGSLAHFCWPVTREQALVLLDDFIQHKLADFGPHQDAMWVPPAEDLWESDIVSGAFLWHSLLASSLILKLLHPREVIAAAEKAYTSGYALLASVEGFIRQILGWREFIRGVYWLDMPAMAEANHYRHQRPLPGWYWTGDTQMNCLRQTICQTLEYGYAHHIQRLMITGMFGLLAEINPREVEAWYLAVYVDAVEWVELPNTGGMALHASGGRFTSKPYVASGAYIKRMSNYCSGCRYKPEVKTGTDACPYTTLYWNFLIGHQSTLKQNPRTALMVTHVNKMTEEAISAIQNSAQQMLKNMDNL